MDYDLVWRRIDPMHYVADSPIGKFFVAFYNCWGQWLAMLPDGSHQTSFSRKDAKKFCERHLLKSDGTLSQFQLQLKGL